MSTPMPNDTEIKIIKKNIKKQFQARDYPSDQSLIPEFLQMCKQAKGISFDQVLEQFNLRNVLERKRKFIASCFILYALILCFYYNNIQNLSFSEFITQYIWMLPGGRIIIFLFGKSIMNDYALIIPALITFDLVSAIILFTDKTVIEMVILQIITTIATLIIPIVFFMLY